MIGERKAGVGSGANVSGSTIDRGDPEAVKALGVAPPEEASLAAS